MLRTCHESIPSFVISYITQSKNMYMSKCEFWVCGLTEYVKFKIVGLHVCLVWKTNLKSYAQAIYTSRASEMYLSLGFCTKDVSRWVVGDVYSSCAAWQVKNTLKNGGIVDNTKKYTSIWSRSCISCWWGNRMVRIWIDTLHKQLRLSDLSHCLHLTAS